MGLIEQMIRGNDEKPSHAAMEYQHYRSQARANGPIQSFVRFMYTNMTTYKPYIYNGLGTGYYMEAPGKQSPRRLYWTPNPQGKQYQSDPTQLRNMQAIASSRGQQARAVLAKLQQQLGG